MYCIYCDSNVDGEGSLEHTIPASLGGALLDGAFKTRDVCGGCNNLHGLFSDGLYIKSFFTQANKALSNLPNRRDKRIKTYPFVYFGYQDLKLLSGYEHCEMWISPCNGRVFHFHNNKDEKCYGYAGGNPIKNKKKNLAIFVNYSQDEELLNLGLRSFMKHFKSSERVVSNVNILNGIDKKLGRYPNEFEKEWVNWYVEEVEQRRNNQHDCSVSVDLGYADRMMGKIALGLGYSLFGESYLQTDQCKKLRNYMWQKDSQKRDSDAVRHRNKFNYNDDSPIPDGILRKSEVTIIVTRANDIILLTMNIFGDEQYILISDDPSLVQSFSKEYKDGIVRVINPIFETMEQPDGFMAFVAKRVSENSTNQ